FFARFLKGDASAWPDEPRVRLQVRHPGERFVERHEAAWPIPRTQWTRYHLHAEGGHLGEHPALGVQVIARPLCARDRPGRFVALGDGVTFITEPMQQEMEITGPIAARLNISSTTDD